MRNGVRSSSQHTFAKAPQANIPRASFDRSHNYKTTFNEGYLVPIFVDEVLPGDTLSLNMTAFARFATLAVPIMDNIYLDSFFFFVPNRLVWDHWEEFNGEQRNPTDSTDYILPTVTMPAGGALVGSLADYFGIPILKAGLEVQSGPFRAYNLIFNEWFRDENLQNSVVVDVDDGPDNYADYNLLRRGKRYDYFTSSLPWPQKINDGSNVTIPLGTSAPIESNNAYIQLQGVSAGDRALTSSNISGTNQVYVDGSLFSSPNFLRFGSETGLVADLTQATAAPINQLRQAFQLQRLYERDARGGTRYTEIIKSHFGVTSDDARLQRPEYLGGGSSMISVNPVAQTSPAQTDDVVESPQANLAAFATGHLAGHGFTKSFTEHGYLIGIVSARADINYQQGLNRMWSRSIRWDFYWPALSHIGEQAVLNKEIYAQGTAADDQVFGYQERYAEYRYRPNQITGLFRSDAPLSLDFWHLAQDFGSLPTLSPTFIVEDAPTERVKAVVNQPDFLLDVHFSIRSARPMPLYGVPGLIDHF